jgi:AcrR family transcriptional regulator
MSSKGERTRSAILDAAMALLQERGPAAVTMAEVAAAAKLTRQALYLHFPTRTELLVATIDHVSRTFGAQDIFKVDESASPRDQLEGNLRAAAAYAERSHGVAQALDLARHSDEAARTAWDDRMAQRRKKMREMMRRIDEEGELAEGWTAERAADALWAVGLPATYGELVGGRGWSGGDYERFLMAVAGAFLKKRRR